MKRSVKLLFAALAAYAVLLVLLLMAESGNPDASIRSFGDALWFSLITMTTVGYGDLSPITPAGRILGAVFALCSIGILTALISLGLSLISGEWIPRLRLRFAGRQHWYAFSAENEDSAALAAALREEDGDCLLIFPSGGKVFEGADAVRLNCSADELVSRRHGSEGLTLFLMGSEPRENYTRGLEAAENGIDCCCMADVAGEYLPHRMQLFSPNEAMSRCYWKEHPLKKSERCVVLIGCGAAGGALLERALLTNVFEEGRLVEYHVFGDSADFIALHPEIMKALGSGDKDEDSLFMHTESWTQAYELLERADRVIVCMDSDEESFGVYERLKRWFGITAQLHVHLAEKVPGLVAFGERSESMRPEFVMKDKINRQARMMNDIYNEGSENPTAWKDLSPFLRQSNIAAADHLIVKARYLLDDETLTELSAEECRRAYARFKELYETQAEALQKQEHRRWMRFYQMYNWQYDPVRDNTRRRHPLLLPYEQLSGEQQRKDAYAWEMLGRLGERED
ncbi:MAG: ion transporter [Oscillospiraceae bacterium]|nr:ion transporter [Oscillospiraceae bacterium]